MPLEPQVSYRPLTLVSYYNADGFNSSFFSHLVLCLATTLAVPDKSSLIEGAGINFENGSEEITAEFTLLQSLVSATEFQQIFLEFLLSFPINKF